MVFRNEIGNVFFGLIYLVLESRVSYSCIITTALVLVFPSFQKGRGFP